MFCPNCGKDCGSANFCIKCGTDLRRGAAAPDTWSVGEPCPYCGGTRLEGDNCAFCGAQLKEDTQEASVRKVDWEGIPLGVYKTFDGYLKLKETYLALRKDKKREHVIPYEQLTEVAYAEPGFFRFGWLTLRSKENEDLPLPGSYADTLDDETTLYFNVYDEELFFRIYHAIKDYLNK